MVITNPDGSFREFQPDSRGGYFASPGDQGTLAASGGGTFTLTEANGSFTTFNTNGTVNSMSDGLGDTISASYTAGLLTHLTSSSGGYLQIQYNAAGRIETITSSTGQTVTYNYDSTNTYLTSVTGTGGTTQYNYLPATGAPTDNVLLSVQYAGGKETSITMVLRAN